MSELKVYLAAPYQMKELIRDRTLELQTLGINVTSSWVNEPEKPTIEVHEVAPQIRNSDSLSHAHLRGRRGTRKHFSPPAAR